VRICCWCWYDRSSLALSVFGLLELRSVFFGLSSVCVARDCGLVDGLHRSCMIMFVSLAV